MGLLLVMTVMVMVAVTTTSGGRISEVTGQPLVSVGVGLSGVWGVDESDRIYYRNETYGTTGMEGNKWILVQGALVQADVGQNVVWGVNRNHNIYIRRGITPQNPIGSSWQQIPGGLIHVSVSPGGRVWGVNVNNDIFIRVGASNENPAGSSWKRVMGKLKQVSVGTVGVWGVNHHNDVYYRENTFGDYDPEGNSWIRISERKMIYVSSALGNVFGLSKDGKLYVRRGMSFARPTGLIWQPIKRRQRGLRTIDSLHGDYWATKNTDRGFVVLHGYLKQALLA